MIYITDTYNNNFNIELKNNSFFELFGLVLENLKKNDPFIDFDNIQLIFTKNDILCKLENNLESKNIFDIDINKYTYNYIENYKTFKYYYKNKPKKILLHNINNINNFIKKLCKIELINNGYFQIILKDFINNKIYYKCYLDIKIIEYWDNNENEFIYKNTFEIFSDNYIFDYNLDYNNIIFDLKIIIL